MLSGGGTHNVKGRCMKLDADKMRWHRDSRGWTLETTAEKAEVALGTVLRAEHGEDIRPSSGRRIAQAFGVDVSELVPDRPGVMPPKAPAPSTSGPHETEEPMAPGAISEAEAFGIHTEYRENMLEHLSEIWELREHMQDKILILKMDQEGVLMRIVKASEETDPGRSS
jgi:transcriptional regulator with XRE-family HTH domain